MHGDRRNPAFFRDGGVLWFFWRRIALNGMLASAGGGYRFITQRNIGEGRHHPDESILQKAFKQAIGKSDFTKRAICHTLRHSFATHWPEIDMTFGWFKSCKTIRMSEPP